MIYKHQKEGFILVLTLMILSIAILLVNQFYVSSTVTIFFDRAMIDREKAKTAALGAINLAKSQLLIIKKKKEEGAPEPKSKEPEKQGEEEKAFLQRIVPVLNRWQTLNLNEKNDGINATIKLCISCEDGKLNINELYDFDKKKFIQFSPVKPDAKLADKKDETAGKSEIETLFESIKKFSDFKDLVGPFEKFLKERHYRLNDVTELLKVKEFQQAFKNRIFYEPPTKEVKETEKRPLYLMDLFTIFTGSAKLEPWLLSDSVSAVMGFTRAQADDIEKRKKEMPTLLKEFNPASNLEKDWNNKFKPLYGKEYKSLTKETLAMFQTTFEPKTFSVMIHATVGTITQKLYVILYRTNQENHDQFITQRLYWL